MPVPSHLHLHHVGYVVKRIEPIVETYVSRYGYDVCTEIIHDPLQTAFVQFLRLPGDQSYLEFVSPDSDQSALSSAAERRGGLNHLCFSCGPLEQTITELEENGMRVISEIKIGRAFNGRRICWMVGQDPVAIELVERRDLNDQCVPGL